MPTERRLPANRMFFANFMSHSLTRLPYISLFRSSGMPIVVVLLPEPPRQPTPLLGVAHTNVAREALFEFQVMSFLLYVIVAVISGPGSDWNTVLTRMSIFGTVYDAEPLIVVRYGCCVLQPARYSAPVRPRTLGASSVAKHESRCVAPVLVPPWTRMPSGARQLKFVSTPLKVYESVSRYVWAVL